MPSLCQNLHTSYLHLRTLTDAFTTTYERVKDSGDLTEVRRLKTQLEEAREALLVQLTTIVVPHATNPYHEALLEAGLEATKTMEQEDIRLDLRKEIQRQLSVYQEAKNREGHPLLEAWVKDIQENEGLIYAEVAKDRSRIVERIKEGMIPVVMPGRSVQEQTWEDTLKYLHPIWMKDGKNEAWDEKGNFLKNDYKTDSTNKMTKEGFFKNIPDRPYLVWVKPTQGIDPETMNKSFDDQQAYYATLVADHPNLYDATDFIPTEYVALHAMATSQIRARYKELQSGTKEPMVIKPLDYNNSYTRFLSAVPFSDGDVPCAYFYSGHRRVGFNCDNPVAYGKVGFRPASRS